MLPVQLPAVLQFPETSFHEEVSADAGDTAAVTKPANANHRASGDSHHGRQGFKMGWNGSGDFILGFDSLQGVT